MPLGVISAVKQDSALDYALRVFSLSGLSLPSFWLGLLILMLFARYAGDIPIYTNQPRSFWAEVLLYSVPAAAVGPVAPLRIAEAGRELHDRVSLIAKYAIELGGSLDKAVEKYNQFAGSLERNVLSSAKRLEQLAASHPDKAIPELPSLESSARPLGSGGND